MPVSQDEASRMSQVYAQISYRENLAQIQAQADAEAEAEAGR